MASSEKLRLRLVGITYGASGINLYRFATLGGEPLPGFDAGAHLDLTIAPGLTRSYSLLWPPPAPDCYEIAVQLEPEGKGGSKTLHHGALVGAIYETSPPRNHFARSSEPAPGHALFAGGIGITPIIGHFRQLKQLGQPVRLYYWTQQPATTLFLAELGKAAPEDMRLFHTGVDRAVPRLADVLATVPADFQLYCCGPAPMIEAFERLTAKRPAGLVHRERFAAALLAEPGAGDRFQVRLQRSGKVLTIDAEESILGACLSAGIDAAYSCEEGVCGACAVRVLSGQVIHRDSVLTPAEREAADTMMICCSRGRGDALVIDL
ncbi:ferredoxin--NADP+ reductase [Arboricoccus pini]|uniref:Ferredoxin--NADP+ reductase n=1 Tax=Arboricoccus pini TaxID=1963835 RepID=A0A212RNM4_9PROT|nr:PDR/VanB family oxidoreductase [Arboricoccus pini]SNB73993.1 ferredoxin--NADP+ reductase [Arboricoccus pini]